MEMGNELIEYIAKSLVDNPDASFLEGILKVGSVSLILKVVESDIGKIIGRSGRVAKAARTVLNVANSMSQKQYNLDILV
ncbi:KH domain-containing protein [Treponema endosymbiont of Eucomonympha sp.]|uniref:KH domain-containing protein n=1 Tax=Treponema endosymbiont of Eucomonympha sp. TaxID=1580831 RepID=UPI000A3F4C95|nr:KH domain-containing protein [Treponema endosymbiont of Eucomonympha sp.]